MFGERIVLSVSVLRSVLYWFSSCPVFRLLQLQRSVLSPDSDIPDELLYGRAGYLYALLYVSKEIGPDAVDETTIAKVILTLFMIKVGFCSYINAKRQQAVKLALIKIHGNASIDKNAHLQSACVSRERMYVCSGCIKPLTCTVNV